LLIALCKDGRLFPEKFPGNGFFCSGASIWVELFRNLPLLCQALFFYYCLHLPGFWAALAALVTYTSAYAAEIYRAGFRTVPATELQSAELLGMNRLQIIRHVLLPRSLEAVVSPLGNQAVNLIKNSAIAYFVAVPDLTMAFETLTSQTYQFVPFFIASLAGYGLLCLMAILLTHQAESYLLRRYQVQHEKVTLHDRSGDLYDTQLHAPVIATGLQSNWKGGAHAAEPG
jgi:ABC-type amino acid transport system permease subunit